MASQSQFQSQVHFLCCFGFLLGLQRPSEATASPGHQPAKPDTDLSPPKYEFGYEVRDDRGGQQGHLEARDGVYALGKYYVKLPDGSDQKVNYFTDDLGYHPLVEYNSASPSGSSRTQFAMGEKAVAALVKSISDIKTTHDFDGARKLAANKKQEGIGKLNADAKNSKTSQKPGSSVYIGLASTPNDIHVESTTPTPHYSATPSPQHSSSISESSNSEEDLYAFDEPTLAPDSNVSPPQGGSLLMHTINLEGGEDPRLSSAHQSLADFGMKLQKNPLSAFLNIHSHKFASTSQPVTSNYVDESVEEVTQRGYTTVEAENYSKNTKEDIVQETSPTVATITTLHTNPYSTINVDVSPNGEDSRAQEINSYTTQHTPTSTHGTTTDRTAEESELRYTVSTTPAPTTPDDTFIRPIVVPDGPFEMQSFYSGLLRTTEEMKNFIANLNRTLIANEGVTDHESGEQYKSTPSPIQHSDLASTEEENSLHTSSNQILAPIQAAVSLSASEISSAEASSNSEEVKALESAELVVEQQTLKKQPVLKTTIDIQKSIPFEIPHQENSYEENEESQSTSNDENSTPYQQGSHLPIHQSINEEFSKIDKDASIQNVRSQFLQQVYSAYQSLANNPNASPYYSQIDSNSNKLALPEPEPTQPPKKLYYVYLQGYNSGLNRYAPLPQYSSLYQNNVHQQGLETNYGSQLTKQIAALPPGSFSQSSAHIYRNGEPNLNVATFINHGNLGQSVQYNRLIEQQPTVNYATEINQDPNPNPSENHHEQYSHNENVQNYNQQQVNVGKEESNRIPLQVQYIGHNSQNLPLNHLNALSAESFHKYLEQTAKSNAGSVLNGYNAVQEAQYNDQSAAVSQNQDINGLRINNFLHSKFLGDEKLKVEQAPAIRPALLPPQVPQVHHLPQVHHAPQVHHVPQVPHIPQVPLTWPHGLPLSRVAHLPYLQPYLQMSQIPMTPYKQTLPYPLTHYFPLQNAVPQVPSQSSLQPTAYNRNDQHENQKKEPQAPFRPSQKLYHSVYPPETYYIAEYMRPNARSRGLGKKLCIEYGGFKPPLIPSVQIDEKLEVNIAKRADKTD